MKPLLVLLAVTAALALATPAGARPIDGPGTPNGTAVPAAPAPAPAPASADTAGGGSDTWVVILAAGIAFVAGAAGARLVALPRAGRASA